MQTKLMQAKNFLSQKSAQKKIRTGHIWLDNVECTGHESFLDKCERRYGRRWGIRNCDHSEDAGVQCTPGIRFTSISITYMVLYDWLCETL